jgi:hypothetical protein
LTYINQGLRGNWYLPERSNGETEWAWATPATGRPMDAGRCRDKRVHSRSAKAMPRCVAAQARRLQRGRTEEAVRRKAKKETTRMRNCGGQVNATRKESWAPEFFSGPGNTIPIPYTYGVRPFGVEGPVRWHSSNPLGPGLLKRCSSCKYTLPRLSCYGFIGARHAHPAKRQTKDSQTIMPSRVERGATSTRRHRRTVELIPRFSPKVPSSRGSRMKVYGRLKL